MNPFRRFLKSKILIFEGITCSGKTTQIAEITRILRDKFSYSVGLANSASQVYAASNEYRKFLKRHDNPLIPYALIHQSTNYLKIEELPQNLDILIVDRFVLSDLVYLCARCELKNITIDKTKAREQILTPFGIHVLKNTETFYIDADYKIASMRINQRKQTDSEGKLRNEFDLSLQAVAREKYLEEIKFAKENTSFGNTIINGNQDQQDVTGEIMQKLEEIITK